MDNKPISKINPYCGLPQEVFEVADRIGLIRNEPKISNQMEIVKKVPEKTFENDVKYATYLLDERNKKSRLKQKRGDVLNAKQRKKLFDLSKGEFKYSTFKKINGLWHSYINDVMKEIRSTNDQIKLVHADFHGAFFVVSASVNPTLIGVKGFVVQETKNTFRIIDKNSRILTIPKGGSIFAFEHNGTVHKLNGAVIKLSAQARTKIRMKIKKLVHEI